MFELKINFATIEALQDAVAKLNSDGAQHNLPLADAAPKAPTKAAVKKAATAEATTEALAAPKKPAAVKGKATKYTLAQLKEHVATLVDPSEGEKIKGFARSFGVAKYSDLSESQIQEAYAGAAAYFAEGEAEETEEDPMN